MSFNDGLGRVARAHAEDETDDEAPLTPRAHAHTHAHAHAREQRALSRAALPPTTVTQRSCSGLSVRQVSVLQLLVLFMILVLISLQNTHTPTVTHTPARDFTHAQPASSTPSPSSAQLASSAPSKPQQMCGAVTNGSRWEVLPWNDVWVRNPEPWPKADYIVPVCGVCACYDGDTTLLSRSLPLHTLVTALRQVGKSHAEGEREYVVNIGAADGAGGVDDPTFEVVNDPLMSALLIDGQSGPTLFGAYAVRENVIIMSNISVSAQTIADVLRSHNVPQQLTVLKVDIDSWECSILDALMQQGFAPLIIHVEINTSFPPPLRFSVLPLLTDTADFKTPIWRQRSAFFGCSLSAAADVLVPRGYWLLEVDGWDATFVREDVAHVFQPLPASVEAAWQAGFQSRLEARPDCFANFSKVSYTVLREFAAQAKVEQAALMNGIFTSSLPVEPPITMAALRKFVAKLAPRHKSDPALRFPYLLAAHGPSDARYKQLCV